MYMNFLRFLFFLCPAHNGAVEETFQHLGQYSYDIYSHFLYIFAKVLKSSLPNGAFHSKNSYFAGNYLFIV